MTDVNPLQIAPPTWACEWGHDKYGIFATFRVGEVKQRLRYLPPGSFDMGSPEKEAGRWSDEGPRHRVILTRGFWLAETPCTQALYEAVVGENPSRFKSPQRPVESVSWHESQNFLTKLGEKVPGLFAELPTEAEWEYACRAGTAAATWKGDLKIFGERNAPLLDKIAWYGGNSGEEFDLLKGHDSSAWPEKQYPHKKAGTREVATRDPNPWGFFDLLGNVWEWCADGKRGYGVEVIWDPVGDGARRVVRGGSWLDYARYVRAAFRLWYPPDDRGVFLGFRFLARDQKK
jgi:formylglycine-generating enzyme required for sulfatase activity